MKTRSIFLLMVFILMLPVTSNAQFGALRRAINKQIDHKVDSAVNKSAQDKAKEKEQTDQNNGGTKATGRGLFGGKIDIKYDDEYKFTGRLYMQMESYDKKEVKKSDFYTYFNSNTRNAGIEVSTTDPKDVNKTMSTVFLYDNDNKCFMMLLGTADSRTGIISTLPSDSAMAAMGKNQKVSTTEQTKNQDLTPAKPPTITKTGNTRVIAGYKCDEYKVVDAEKEGYSNVWMTKDVNIKADKKYWGKAGMPTYYGYPEFEGAVMLAMEGYDKDNNPTMKMETKEINNNYNHSISTVGYTFMKMNFGQAGKK
jgi:Domain of unknown function (DUF4412)